MELIVELVKSKINVVRMTVGILNDIMRTGNSTCNCENHETVGKVNDCHWCHMDSRYFTTRHCSLFIFQLKVDGPSRLLQGV